MSGSQSADSVLWKQQLDAIMKNTVEYHLEYVLTDYKYLGKISTEEDLERVKLAILDGTGYPAEAYGKTRLVSLKEFSSIDKKGRKYQERCKEEFGSNVAVASWTGRSGIRVDMQWHYL